MNENKQIEEMAKIIDGIEDNAYTMAYGFEAEADSEKIAEALYNAGYRKQEWISVEDRLPVPCTWVLVYIEYYMGVDFITASGEWCKHPWQNVTHWMPLPEPPTKEDD